jgi:WD40 repeat protein
MASDPDRSDSDDEAPTSVNRSGGIDIDAKHVDITGDVIGRDKIVGYTVDQVQTLLAQISSTFQPKPFDGRCPYLGLDAFSEDDADRFFGREMLIAELIERVKVAHFLVIAGPSGSGKSSLVRAGLLHQLKHNALSNSDRWLYATLTPGRDPIESLALAVSRLKSPDLGDYLRQHSTDPNALHKCAESALSDLKDQRVVIFVDQFEEVFTQVSKESDRVAFLNLLTTAATIDNGRVTVLFALRSDFVTNCATYPQLNALVNQQFLLVGAMRPDELVSAIARPALEVGLRIDPDLVKQIVDDMADEPGALPLMQFALKDLFDAEQAKDGVIVLTLSDYLARGGLRKALERHADAAFAKLDASEQQLARSIFGGLIEIGSGREDTRRTASFAELVPASVTADPVKAVIQKLADARLITTAEQDHKETVTISHEKLIDAWPWLRKLIDENRESIALHNEITSSAQEWDRNQRNASYLYTGARLATAREQLAAKKIVLNGLAQAFVETGIQTERNELEEIKQHAVQLRKRAIYLSGALGIALIAVIVAIIFGIQSQKQARISLSRQLAAQSISHVDSQFDLALLLSIESGVVDDTVEARSSLLTGLESHPGLTTLLRGHTIEVTSVAFNPDGKTMASGSMDKTIILWDVSNPKNPIQLGAPLSGHSDYVSSIAFSPDGKTLASGGLDSTIILWDVSNPKSPVELGSPLSEYSESVSSVAFSPDGKTLASGNGNGDGTIILWDVSNQQLPVKLGTPLNSHAGGVNSVAFSPDGKTLASGNGDGTIILWDVSNPKTPVQLGKPFNLINPLSRYSESVFSVTFSPDGKTLASGSDANTIILWDVSNPKMPVRLGAPLSGHRDYMSSIAFSPDGKTLASGGLDGTIILWDVSNPKSPVQLGTPLRGHIAAVISVAFSPDGKTLASGGDYGTIILWDVSNPKSSVELGMPLTGHTDGVFSVAFSPDSKTLASGSCGKIASISNYCIQGEIILWDVSNPQLPVGLGAPLTGHTAAVYSVTFSPDGKTLASGSYDKTIILWDVSDPQTPVQLGVPLSGHGDAVQSEAFSPDGKTLASGGLDGTIILWNMSNPKSPVQLGTLLRDHTAAVTSVAFSPDGKTLASGSDANTIILWDVSNPQLPVELGTPLSGHSGSVLSVDFSPDGKILASGSEDKTIILWDVDPDSWRERACQIAHRNLTQAEWTQYLGDEPYRLTCPQWPAGQ